MDQTRREFLAVTAQTYAALTFGGTAAAQQGPPLSDELAFISLSQASELIRARKVSPLELTRACLAGIERFNPRLNAFITVTAPEALAEAKEAEAEIGKERWRDPLHGEPIAHKDLLDDAGVRP